MYQNKYLKYKNKYLKLKSIMLGGTNLKLLTDTLSSMNYYTYNNFSEMNIDYVKEQEILKYYDDLIKMDYINSTSNIYESKKLNDDIEYIYTIEHPRYWQEFYYIYYLSLKIIKENYKSNSVIISLGESPNKLTYCQSLFYDDNVTSDMMINCGYPGNISFMNIPISGLAKEYVKENYELYHTYFKRFHIDPLTIINDDKNYIIIDRCESGESILMIFEIYIYLISKLTREQQNNFLSKFIVIGYDIENENILETTNKVYKYIGMQIRRFGMIKRPDSLISKLFTLVAIKYSSKKYEKIFNHLRKNYEPSENNGDVGNVINLRFDQNYLTIPKIISFFSLPENNIIHTRCIRQYNVVRQFLPFVHDETTATNPPDSTNFMQKRSFDSGSVKPYSDNCNLIDSTKSMIFIASLQVSFKNKLRLNDLFEIFVLFVVLL